MSNNQLPEFLLKEYDNIAEAHFNTNDKISDFFKSYLTIMSIPLSILTLLVNLEWFQTTLSNADNGKPLLLLLGIIFFVITALGFFIFLYIINLHLDSILYARTINGIRKFFIDSDSESTPSTLKVYINLPTSPSRPPYMNLPFFGPIVLAFVVINLVYFIISWGLIYFSKIGLDLTTITNLKPNPCQVNVLIAISIAFVILHWLSYRFFCNYREKAYLRSKFIGVDIDGVLNFHREQFSEKLEEKTGIVLRPEDITSIPVRDIEGYGISAQEEMLVFNDPDYWISMPSDKVASDILSRIKNSLNLRVFIFTSRPWPIGNEAKENATKEFWKLETNKYSKRVFKNRFNRIMNLFWQQIKSYCHSSGPLWYLLMGRLKYFFRNTWLDRITVDWLSENGFEYDHILIEKANEIVSDPALEVLNRFYIAKKLRFQFFVEDDLLKAKKLSTICDFVFLIDQPYNHDDSLPKNIIRVKDWNELYKEIKSLV